MREAATISDHSRDKEYKDMNESPINRFPSSSVSGVRGHDEEVPVVNGDVVQPAFHSKRIFRARDMSSSAMEMIPPLPDLNQSGSFVVEIDVEKDDADIPTNYDGRTPKRREKQVSDLSIMTVEESEPHLAFLKNAFVSAPDSPQQQPTSAGPSSVFGWWLDLDPSRSCDTIDTFLEFPNKDDDKTSNKRVKQVSNITALTADMSVGGSTVAPMPPRNCSRYHRKTDKVKPTPDHVEVPAFPSLTATSFEDKERYRGLHRNLKVRLNKMAKLHYFRTTSK
mmetsp:Transcript_10882/g.23028  ORF Transcript_10882/g.23028 Transcript_10882/m.23028 type:complete len:280 (-) Transcript_10882:1191-2030(-)|eukprot:CAMPEP_0178568556 /NCGR_PEP_ID=MMETSP0697-20121206/15979_1 /TAXON_ID=265572 /ORGANISM="Extubocellulus spinifer, Strain CCMP396" /LENGTH=279 /DNA_ID=CAMNT_0020202679 /DNA_START=92 /DNA_END=931 /DNA_ORIENTATION=+